MNSESSKKNSKAVLLLSGGLDSILAGQLLLDQNVDVTGLNFTSPFCNCSPKGRGCSAAVSAAKQLGVPVKVKACGQDYLEILKHPRFGRGSGMNPCIDCRIHLFSNAKRFMQEIEADFVATGEVLGERPMSQRRQAMLRIEKESGLSGQIVRPLSARHFEPSLAEQRGLVDRDRLLALEGRSRKPQIALADHYGITDYPCPAGGCKLTESGFAAKFEELLTKTPSFGLREAKLLSWGRHFRLHNGIKIIVGRDAGENDALAHLIQEQDSLVRPLSTPGPSAMVCGSHDEDDCLKAAGIAATFIKKADHVEFEAMHGPLPSTFSFRALAPLIPYFLVESWRIREDRQEQTCIC